MKKLIECCDCGTICKEVKQKGYPKIILEPGVKKIYNEYRYVCPKCNKEWVHDTLQNLIFEVPKDAQFHFKVIKGKVILISERIYKNKRWRKINIKERENEKKN